MKSISYTSFRGELASVLEQVNNDHTPILVTRQKGENSVVMSEEDFRAYEETAHLMQSSANATRLNDAIAQLRSGEGNDKELLD